MVGYWVPAYGRYHRIIGRRSIDQLRIWCEGRLSPYKIPRRLLVVDDLARNAMGKVNKPKVAEMFGE
ncbi:hypothetical protein [Aeoliella sp. SH292]|uniref:hypothetical protein n=1 Tax=Aeoliella sp. SH292 TaxID=3454464 RepID=UPI003F96D177